MIRVIFGLILISSLLWLTTDWVSERNEITVHLLFCDGTRTATRCNGREETANPTTYKVFVDQQAVVYWSWGSSDITRFTFCAVRDRRNWSCQFEPPGNIPSTEFKMIGGDYFEKTDPPNPIDIFYPVSRWRWWWIRALDQFRPAAP